MGDVEGGVVMQCRPATAEEMASPEYRRRVLSVKLGMVEDRAAGSRGQEREAYLAYASTLRSLLDALEEA